MAYFPFFVNLKGKIGLIVGGGKIALHKIEKLILYEPVLEVCAPEILPEITEISGLVLKREPFREEHLNGKNFVIAATDDRELNREISLLCQDRGMPVNAVDDRNYCTFLFPSLVQKGSMTIGICTSGASPTAAQWTRKQIENMIPERFDRILDYLEQQRETVKRIIPDENMRSAVYRKLFAACIEKGAPLNPEEAQMILQDDAFMSATP